MSNISIFVPDVSTILKIPIYFSKISAGFPSPADDYVEKKLDLNAHLIKSPAATFFVRVSGDSMTKAGIFNGDLLIVDKSLEVKNEAIVIAIINGEFTVKRFVKKNDICYLVAENDKYKTIEIKEGMDFEVWGVVTNVIHEFK